jgi:hypothetical protein
MAKGSSFTPWPWNIVPQNRAGPIIAHRFDTGNQMTPTGLRLIAHVLERGNSLEQDRANADLIAAAPDMYTALKALADKGEMAYWAGEWQAIQVALAKAEGRT